jgi:hypothetical protein
VKPAPRWGPLPWFVLVLTLLLILLVAVLPPLVLDETPPAWVMRAAARAASRHGDPDPISAEWFKTTRAEAAEILRKPVAQPSPLPSGATESAGPSATPTLRPLEEPDRPVYVVVLRGRFNSAAPGGQPPAAAPERWLVIAYDSLSHARWKSAVLTEAPALPDESASFEFE